MKILALSDEVLDNVHTPDMRDRFCDVDLVIGCGDLPYYYLEFIVTLLRVPVYYVPGNHDRNWQYRADGYTSNRAEGCELLDRQVRAHTAPGRPPLLLAGLGGCVRYNLSPDNQHTQSEMWLRALNLAPALAFNRLRTGRYLDILVTHAPPRGIHDAPDPAHVGFDAFLWLMRLFRPRLLLHGHSHVYRSATVTQTDYHATRVINVYPLRELELEHAA